MCQKGKRAGTAADRGAMTTVHDQPNRVTTDVNTAKHTRTNACETAPLRSVRNGGDSRVRDGPEQGGGKGYNHGRES